MSANYTSFLCPSCRTEIQTSLDMIGLETECPACGAMIVIPDIRDDDVARHGVDEIDPIAEQAIKSRTIRIELGDF